MRDYKVNGIDFFEENGCLRCIVEQGGIRATYDFSKGKFQKPAKYVLMDLDGTTVKSEEFWIYLIQKTIQELMGDSSFTINQEDIPYVSGFSTMEHLSYCIEKYGVDKTVIEADSLYHIIAERELNEILEGRGNIHAFRPREGLKEFLYELKSRGIKIGLVTSGLDYKAIPEIVSTFRLLDMGDPLEFYDAIITGGKRKMQGNYGTIGELASKPHPWVYSEIALGLGVQDKSKAIVLEDSSAGLISGRLAGFDVIGFNDGNLPPSGLSDQAYAMVDNFKEVLELL